MNWTDASYKLKHGFQFMFIKDVVDCMKRYHFCINIGEYAFNNSQKILSIHLSYFDIEIGDQLYSIINQLL